MPMDEARYPANWRKIVRQVKEAAGRWCQGCVEKCRQHGEPLDNHKRTKTVHHIYYNPENCSRENLLALRAPCHPRADAQYHAENRKEKKRCSKSPSPSRE